MIRLSGVSIDLGWVIPIVLFWLACLPAFLLIARRDLLADRHGLTDREIAENTAPLSSAFESRVSR
jgi:hypothetical protein